MDCRRYLRSVRGEESPSPSKFPVPSDATPAGSGSLENASKDVMIAVYTTSSASDAYNFYTGQSSLNPTDEKHFGVGSAFLGSMKISGECTGSVTVAGAASENFIVVVLNPSSGTTTAS